jgi:ATP phosphoribosyltransferase regulatory subunit HisZ
VGRGGRYQVDANNQKEPIEATGFTLYVETLRSLLPEAKRSRRVLLADGIWTGHAEKLRIDGYVTVPSLSEYGNDEEEAKRLDCGFIFKNGKLKEI